MSDGEGKVPAMKVREFTKAPGKLHGCMSASVLSLRAANNGDSALSDDERIALLESSRAGQHVELMVDIQPFSQVDGQPNRNHVRFRKGALMSLGKSGTGSVFLRDHSQGSLEARGGTIVASKMSKADGGHVLDQRVHVTEPWAVQGFLSGKIDRFSIGWHPTGRNAGDVAEVLCTACKANVQQCYHWPGDVAEVNGQQHVVEFEFQAAELVETSAVVVPAVKGTGVDNIRAALGLSVIQGNTRMPENQATEKAKDNKPDTAALNEAALAERERGKSIRQVASKLGLEELGKKHIDEGTSADEFRALAIDKWEAEKLSPVSDHGRPSVTVELGRTEDETFHESLVCAILAKCGMLSRVRGLASGQFRTNKGTIKIAESTMSKLAIGERLPEHRGSLTLMELLKGSERRKGQKVDGLDAMRVVGNCFRRANFIEPAAHGLSGMGYAATGDFTVALEEAIHKMALAGYAITPDTWSRICSVASLGDFRPHNMYRIGEQNTWELVPEHGEFKQTKLPDARRELNQLDTYGRIMKITRQTIINDDLNLITRQAQAFGRAGARVPEIIFYALLAKNGGFGPNMASDNLPLFDPAHNNIGDDSVLSVAGLEADRVLMEDQQDDQKKDFLTIVPSILLVGNNQRAQALRLNNAEFDIDPVAPASQNLYRSPNVVNGLFDDIVASPRAKAISETRRWLFADPAEVETFQMGFLNGQREPTIESRDGWTVDGTQWKGRLDVGIAAVDYKGAVTNAGT